MCTLRSLLMALGSAVICAVVCVTLAPAARAEFLANVAVETAVEPDGNYLYRYIVTVSAESGLSSSGLVVTVDSAANLRPGGVYPEGWDVFYSIGDPSIGWGADEFAGNLLPGSRTEFSFESPLPPVPQRFTLFGIDDSGEHDGIIEGDIVGPGLVAPEPSSAVLMGIGLVSCGYIARRRKPSRLRDQLEN